MTELEIKGFAYYARNINGKEFVVMQSFGFTKANAKKAFLVLQNRRCEQHRPMLEALAVCNVAMRVTSIEWVGGLPPLNHQKAEDVDA